MNIDEFRKQYPQYENVSDRKLTETLYDKYYKEQVNPQEFNQKFLDKDEGSFYAAVGAQNKMRGLFDEIAKTEEGSGERQELLKDLSFEQQRFETLLTPFSENPLAWAGENAALGLKSFLAGAGTGAVAGGGAGALAGGVGAAPGATLGGFLGGLGGVAYDSYNIWQAENLARAFQEDENITDEDIKTARQAAVAQAGIETALSAIPVGGALTKAFGRKATGEILKEVSKAALVAGSLEATAGGLNQTIHRAVIPELDTFDEEGIEEIFSAAAASFMFGAALGTGMDLTAAGASTILNNAKKSTIDPVKDIDQNYERLGYRAEEDQNYDGIKTEREQNLRDSLNEENLETAKNFNAPRTEEGAFIQAALESVYNTPEQIMRLRRMSEAKIKSLDAKIKSEAQYKTVQQPRKSDQARQADRRLRSIFTKPEEQTAIGALTDEEVQNLSSEIDEIKSTKKSVPEFEQAIEELEIPQKSENLEKIIPKKVLDDYPNSTKMVVDDIAFMDFTEHEGEHFYQVFQNGKIISNIDFSFPDSETLRIDMIRNPQKRGEEANSLGPKTMRKLLRAFKTQFPNIKKVEGDRVSGGRYQGTPVDPNRQGEEKAKLSLSLDRIKPIEQTPLTEQLTRTPEGIKLQEQLENRFKAPEQRERLRSFTEEQLNDFAKKVEPGAHQNVFDKYTKNSTYNNVEQQHIDNTKKAALKEPIEEQYEAIEPDLNYIEGEDIRADEALRSLDTLPKDKPVGKPLENAKQEVFNLSLSALGAGRSNPYRAKAMQFHKIIEDTTEALTFRKLQKADQSGLLRMMNRQPELFKNIHNKIADFRAGNGFIDDNGVYRYKDRNGVEQSLNPIEAQLAKTVSDFYKTDLEDFRNLTISRLRRKDPRIRNVETAKNIYNSLNPESQKAKNMRSDYEALTVFDQYLKRPLYVPFKRFGQFVGAKFGDGFYTLELKDSPIDRATSQLGFLESIGDGKYVSKKELKDLRERVKKEQGIDIGDKPNIQQTAPRNEKGTVDSGVFFYPSIDSIKNLSDPAVISALANELEGVSKEAADFARNLADDKELNRLKRMFRESRDVPGYSNDWDRVFRDSLQGRSHTLAQCMVKPAMDKLRNVGDRTTRNYIDYVENGDQTFTPVRIGSAVAAFGAAPATAFLNLTTAMTTGPLAMGIYTGNYAAQVAKIYPKMANTLPLMSWQDGSIKLSTENLEKVLGSKKRAEQARRNASVLFQNTTMEIKSKTIASRDGLRKVSREMMDYSFSFLRNTELASRLSIWETAMDDLERIKRTDPAKFQSIIEKASTDENLWAALESKGNRTEEEVLANHVVERAHGVYGAHGRAYYQRGVGSLIVPFTTYVQNAFELYMGAQFDLKNPKRVAMALGMSTAMAFMFGLQGVPIYQVMEPIWQAYNKLVKGKEYSMPRNDIIKILQDNGVPDDVINFLIEGTVGQTARVDIASRVGVGNPYAGPLRALLSGNTQDIGYVGGALGSILQDPTNAESYINNITTARNIVNAAQQFTGQEGYKTSRGETIIPSEELKTYDIFAQALGFRPMRFSEAMSVKQAERRDNPRRYTAWEQKQVKKAFNAYKQYVKTGDYKHIDKIDNVWEDIVKRYIEEGHSDFITSQKQKAFWDKLMRLQYNYETGESITLPSGRERLRGERMGDIYDGDSE